MSTYANGRLIKTPAPRSGRRRRRAVVALAVFVLLLAGAAALGVAYVRMSPDRVPANTFVAGVAVGGLESDRLTAVLESQVRPRVELPLEVTAGADQFELTARDLGIRLDVPGTARSLLARSSLRDRLPLQSRPRHDVAARFSMNSSVAETTLDQKLDGVRHGPANATVELPRPTPVLQAQGNASYAPRKVRAVVHAGRSGQSVDMTTAATAIRDAVASGRRAVSLEVRTVEPRISTASLDRVDQLIGTFTTYHACCEPRVTNIQRIAELIDGTIVLPGATFSLNKASGERTAARGFVAAPAIADGELVQQFGGGVSQFSTTLFNATWFSGLPTLKHQPHSKYISRYPPGREATLDFATIDQVFKNDTRGAGGDPRRDHRHVSDGGVVRTHRGPDGDVDLRCPHPAHSRGLQHLGAAHGPAGGSGHRDRPARVDLHRSRLTRLTITPRRLSPPPNRPGGTAGRRGR